MNAPALLAETHASILRLVADNTGQHFNGLAQISRQKSLPFTARQRRLLRDLDITHNWVRHVTSVKCKQFVGELTRALDGNICIVGSSTRADGDSTFYHEEVGGGNTCVVGSSTQVDCGNTGLIGSSTFAHDSYDGNTCVVGSSTFAPAAHEGNTCVVGCSTLVDFDKTHVAGDTLVDGATCADDGNDIHGTPSDDGSDMLDPLPDIAVQENPYYNKSVTVDDLRGTIQDILIDRSTSEVFYEVRYEDGDLQHMSQDEVRKYISSSHQNKRKKRKNKKK